MNKKSAGRKGRYETDVKPRFDEIAKWASMGATDKEIRENLGLSSSAYFKYKAEHGEFMDLIKKSRKRPVSEIKAALYKRAVGFQYSEIKEIEDSEGYSRTERLKKTSLPDPAAAMILLKHWAKDEGWTNDPQLLALRKEELKLKKELQEDW